MPASYVHSALASRAASLADDALESPEGVSIFYPAEILGGMAGAKVAAKRFQTAFNTLRTRDRNRIQRGKGESTKDTLTDTYSKYDSLACLCNPKEEGFEIQLIRAHLIDVGVVVRDIASGEELRAYTPIGRTANFYLSMQNDENMQAEREGRKPRNVFTPDHIKWFEENDPGAFDVIKESFGRDIRKEMKLALEGNQA